MILVSIKVTIQKILETYLMILVSIKDNTKSLETYLMIVSMSTYEKSRETYFMILVSISDQTKKSGNLFNDRINEPIRKKSGNLFHDTGINK